MKDRLKRKVFEYFRDRDYLYEGIQRVMEYQWCCDQLPDDSNSVLLDTGCDTDARFAVMLAYLYRFVHCNDPLPMAKIPVYPPNMQYYQMDTQEFAREYKPAVNAVTCISVLEHVEDKCSFCEALDLIPAKIIMTCEYAPDPTSPMSSSLVDLRCLTDCLSLFKRHYLSSTWRCPVYAFNSPCDWVPIGLVLEPNGG